LPALGGFWPDAAVFLLLNLRRVKLLIAPVGAFEGSFGVVLAGLAGEVFLDLDEVVSGDEHRDDSERVVNDRLSALVRVFPRV